MKLRKSNVIIVSLVLLFTLMITGCSNASSGKDDGKIIIGYSPLFLSNSWQAQSLATLEKAVENNPDIDELIVANPEGSPDTQINQIRNMIDKGVDAIILMANSPTALNPVIKEAEEAGVKVVVTDALTTSEDVTSQIFMDQVEWGSSTAEWLVEKLNGEGKIVVLNGPAGNSSNNDRWEGAKSVFDQYDGIEILAEANADWDQAKAQTTVANWLSAYPEIDGVWSQGGAMTAGAIAEFEKANRELVPMVGEAYNGFLKKWDEYKDEGFSSVAPVLPNYGVQIALEVALRAIDGEEVPKTVYEPVPLVTDETLQDFVQPDQPDDLWIVNWLEQDKIDEIIDASMSK